MSLILDAINRSQRERANPGDVPGIATQHYVDSSPPRGAWRLPLLLLALVLALAVIVWLLLRPAPQLAAPAPDAGDLVSSVPEPAPATPAPVAAAKPAPAPLRESPRVAKTADRADDRPAASEKQGRTQGAVEPADKAQDPAVAALYSQAARAESAADESMDEPAPVAPAAASATASAAAGRTEEPVAIETLLRRAREEMDAGSLPPHPAPMLGELSQQQKDAIPTLLYSAHDFRGDGGDSSVLINGNSVRVGGRVAAGVQVTEILPDSVVLEHAGRAFRLKALNSWVNL